MKALFSTSVMAVTSPTSTKACDPSWYSMVVLPHIKSGDQIPLTRLLISLPAIAADSYSSGKRSSDGRVTAELCEAVQADGALHRAPPPRRAHTARRQRLPAQPAR
jgi:hypothetical protein